MEKERVECAQDYGDAGATDNGIIRADLLLANGNAITESRSINTTDDSWLEGVPRGQVDEEKDTYSGNGDNVITLKLLSNPNIIIYLKNELWYT